MEYAAVLNGIRSVLNGKVARDGVLFCSQIKFECMMDPTEGVLFYSQMFVAHGFECMKPGAAVLNGMKSCGSPFLKGEPQNLTEVFWDFEVVLT